MDIFLTIISFLLILGVLVIVHECGHFIASKISGVGVEEFGIGFPPRLAGKIFRGTLYSLNLLPVGGFVKIKGMGNASDAPRDTVPSGLSFMQRPFRTKASILLAGVFMNLAAAVVLLSISFAIGFQMPKESAIPGGTVVREAIVISSLLDNGPAAQAGVLPGDALVSINNEKAASVEKVQSILRARSDQVVHLLVQRADDTIALDVVPTMLSSGEQSFIGIGVGLYDVVTVRYGVLQSLGLGMRATVSALGQILVSFYTILRDLVQTQTFTGEVTGPVGIAVMTRDITQQGIVPLLQFAALLSLNLAIFNLLPIPALDGGRFLFAVIEKIRRKPLRHEIESTIHNIGFLLLLLLIALVTFHDIRNF